MRETLKSWLGSAAAQPDLPIPALVTVELKPGLTSAQLEGQVSRQFPGTTMMAETAQLGPLLRSLHMLEGLAFALVTLVAVATSAAVVLAARGALDTHRFTIEIMHGIGATDRQVTRLFERKIATDALIGAIAGALAAAVGLLLVGGAGAAFAGELAGRAPLGTLDLMILGGIPILVVVLAILVARWAILKALRETL
jgi:cell division transport system permease protein